MRLSNEIKVDKTCRLSNFHLSKVDITCRQNGHHLLLIGVVKVKISLSGSDSE